MGIGGTLMGHTAILAKQLGDTVIGTDGPIYPPMSTALKGMEIYTGYGAARLEKLKPDAVVIGNVIGRGNPEIEWFWDKKPCPFYSTPEFIRERVLKNRKTIAVCGTHGKTTTTTLTAYLLKNNKMNPGWLIGGVPQDLPSGAEVGGANSPFVIEGDEYDSAFFDKRAKFISYRPTVAVLNNLELDHLDIYRDIDDLKRAFNHLLRTVPASGVVIANRDDENLRAILPVKWVNTLWVSANNDPEADLLIKNYRETPEGSSFELFWRGKLWAKIEWGLGGLFNARNAAMAALAAGWTMNPDNPTEIDLSSLKNFVGVKRRQEVRHYTRGLVVVEDFAHHPTAVELTLNSLRARFPNRRWIACLEPRSNTSRSNAHQTEYAHSLSLAEIAVISPIHNAQNTPKEKRLDLEKLSSDIRAKGSEAYVLSSCAEIPELLQKLTSDGKPTGIVFFSNGSFEGAMAGYIEGLKQKAVAV